VREFEFTKMQGLGNDFIFLDGLKNKLPKINFSRMAKTICNRATGVGADGLILILPSRKYDFRMRAFNSDGSEAEMCGNGFRCMIRYLTEYEYSHNFAIDVETLAGKITGEVVKSTQKEYLVKVAMGCPEFESKKIPIRTSKKYFVDSILKVGNKGYEVTCVSIGNPHTVLFVDTFNTHWKILGEQIENHKVFLERTNVEFVKVASKNKIRLISWERGAGPTMASGTGATAAVAAGIHTGRLNRKVEVVFDLGSLFINWDKNTNQIYKTGPAEYVFSGKYYF
jgi:diaminopimelate epimerase